MKVKALCTIKDGTGWHMAGEVFETDEDLGNLVEVVEKAPVAEPTEAPEVAEIAEKPKPKTSRKKNTSK